MKIEQISNWQHFENRAFCSNIKYLIVHSFALSVSEMIDVLNQYKLAVHYIIDTKGKIIQLVKEDKLAHHAGKSYWNGDENLNEISIGIELQNMALGQIIFPEEQMSSFKLLAKRIIKKHKIHPHNILGHSDVAPTRKVDPEKYFPWADLAKDGIGIWTDDTLKNKNPDIKRLLQKIGYDVQNEKAALYAFIRHFMPSEMPCEQNIYQMEENLLSNIDKYEMPTGIIVDRLTAIANLYDQARK